jgi:Tfp pilus assembly pilus retraction ATPase PilT
MSEPKAWGFPRREESRTEGGKWGTNPNPEPEGAARKKEAEPNAGESGAEAGTSGATPKQFGIGIPAPEKAKANAPTKEGGTISDEDLGLWWKTLMGFVAEKKVTDILFSPESHEVFCRVNTGLELYQRVGKENYDRLIYDRMIQDRDTTGGKRDLVVASKIDDLLEHGESDFAITTFGRRMRVNVFKSLKGLCAAFRPLPNKTIPWRDNGLTESVMKILDNTKQGLVLVTGPTGSGKCWGKGTELIMFDGSLRPVEEIKPGELLMGPDSKPRKVLSTTRGKGPLYRIEPVKGESWVCNDAHVMTLKRSVKGQQLRPDGRKRNDGEYQAFGTWFQGAPGKKRTEAPQEIVDVPLQEFLDRTGPKQNISQFWKLFRTGVDFPTPKEIAGIETDHFYYLGLWLGDGTRKSNTITNLDEAVVAWVKNYGNQSNWHSRSACYHPDRPELLRIGASQNISRAKKRHAKFPFIIGKEGENFCLKTFLGCCLETPKGVKAPNLRKGEGPKCIPLWAQTSTREQRLALLAGLMDTDGSLGSNCFDFTNKEKALVEATAFIARSLGLWASPPKEKIVAEKTYWRITISGETDIVPTMISRKQASVRKQKKDALVTGWEAERIGRGEYFGFELDGDGRCLLKDFTVTHNSTTLCSMLEYINEKHPYHIITIEDPIEYIFTNKRCVIDQREVKEHTDNFQSALRASLRENPDIIFVGELRDYETARTALMAADTGHLVLATLHTRRVYSTISRLLEMAPESSRSEMRAMLANAIAMILCQRLLKRKGGGVFPCREIMMLNPAISALIKESKEKGISNQLTINQARGMMEWGRALELAVEAGHITKEEMDKYRDSTEDID